MPYRRTLGHYGTFITRRSQILQKIGSCVLLVGVPIAIMGIIFTIVAYGNIVKSGHVLTFSVLGPVLISTGFVCFLVGFILLQMTEETLAAIYSYVPNAESHNVCCCLLNSMCPSLPYRRSRGDNSRRPTDMDGTNYPRSILHHSSRTGHKLMVNRVHFDSQSDDDGITSERSLSNCSIISLQRHCRVFPSQLSWESNSDPEMTGNLEDTELALNDQPNGNERPVSASLVLPEIDNDRPEIDNDRPVDSPVS